MKTIKKAMSFLRTHVAAGTRDAVMKDPEVARMFHDAATIVRDRLQARPQDSASLVVPNLCNHTDVEEEGSGPIIISDDESDSDGDDEIFVARNMRPRPHLDLPPAQRAAHVHPAQDVAFDDEYM
jgi:hypothetical protein